MKCDVLVVIIQHSSNSTYPLHCHGRTMVHCNDSSPGETKILFNREVEIFRSHRKKNNRCIVAETWRHWKYVNLLKPTERVNLIGIYNITRAARILLFLIRILKDVFALHGTRLRKRIKRKFYISVKTKY